MKIDLSQAKQQYFKLMMTLSKSNRTSNEKIHLYFFIDESTPNRKLYGAISLRQKLLLSSTNRFNWWTSEEPVGFEALGQFTSHFANANPYTSGFSEKLISALFRLQDE